MNAAATMQVYDGYGKDCPFKDKIYRIYSDGTHYIARVATRAKVPKRPKREKTEIDDIFAFLYADGLKCDMTDKELREFILTNLEDHFPAFPDLEKYVNENVDRMIRNAWQREKRFRRKAYLNRWNYFVTFTYNGKKQTVQAGYSIEPYKNKALTLTALIDVFYPIGSAFTSTLNISPQTMFGGSWQGPSSSVPGTYTWYRMS